MSDARWLDVDDDLASAVSHFSRSIEIFERNGFAGEDLPAYMARMALMQAMQSGYTSLEIALERILEILGEEKGPTIIRICSGALAGKSKVTDQPLFPGSLPKQSMRPDASGMSRARATTAFVSRVRPVQ